MTTWIRYVVPMLTALAFAAPVGAQTENAQLGRVLGERAQAAANLSTQVESARASALARSELESALTARGQALNKALVASQPSVDGTGGGFDWAAAGGGAGATLVLVLGAMGTVFLVRRSRRAVTGVAVVIASLAVAATASGHVQTVAPPGQDDPVILNDPIAQPWVQGHCHAQAPAISGEASGGVASFSPAGALPCPPVPNPGGQVTGP